MSGNLGLWYMGESCLIRAEGVNSNIPFAPRRWPYSDTQKLAKNSGYSESIFLGLGSQAELDQLESILASGVQIQVLLCEIPSNPLLQTPDLHRIRDIADRYGFCVVCDETVGTFMNVDILPYVDVAITSLTKIFSGASNVMGGRLVSNKLTKNEESS
jgi:cystathionine gamma-synthase